MTTVVTHQCDVCNCRKDNAEGWLRMTLSRTEGITLTIATEGKKAFFDGLVVEDICGAECAQKRISQWLTQQGI
jgi:hypothetical protein